MAGVDGCRGGWVVVTTGIDADDTSTVEVVGAIAEVVDQLRSRAIVALGIDMPIGLSGDGRRAADDAARRLLGPRRSSLFPTPPAAGLDAIDYADALARCRAVDGRGISVQAYNLVPKVRELRASASPDLQPALAEVHPETSFTMMGGAPCRNGKRHADGAAERVQLLLPHFPDVPHHAAHRPRGAAVDDVLDAFAAAWTARRIARGTATILGDPDARDARGFRLTIAV